MIECYIAVGGATSLKGVGDLVDILPAQNIKFYMLQINIIKELRK